MPSASRPSRWAWRVVGCGDIGAQNAEAITRVPGTVLAGCFDADPRLARDLAARFGTVPDDRLEELLGRPEIEAVLVATPHDTHEQLALAVLASGKHLLLQKPLAADLPGAARIAAAAARADVTASVLMPGRYEPGYRLARTALDRGWLGPAAGLVSTYLVDKPASYYRSGYTRRTDSGWRLSKARSGGGVLIMNLTHHLDIACSLLRAHPNLVFAETVPSPTRLRSRMSPPSPCGSARPSRPSSVRPAFRDRPVSNYGCGGGGGPASCCRRGCFQTAQPGRAHPARSGAGGRGPASPATARPRPSPVSRTRSGAGGCPT